MDSTIIGQECIDELADYAGLKAEVAAITERAMRGELDFEAALRERVRAARRAGRGGDRPLPRRAGARPTPARETLVQTMRARGASCLLVSGGFLSFAEPVAQQVGFDRVRANRLDVADGVLDRRRSPGRSSTRRPSARRWSRCARSSGSSRRDVLAVGDGANDMLMIEEAGLGIAYRAKPALAEVADARLDHHGLDALLWAQGIPRRDWVSG